MRTSQYLTCVQDGGKYYCVLDWDRPWLFQSHEIYLLVTVLLVPG